MQRSKLIGGLALLGAAIVLAACAGSPGPAGPAGPAGPTGPQGPAGPAPEMSDLSCTACHNDTTLISGKHTAWAESAHGSGEAYVRGTSASCAGCHSGGAAAERIAAGLAPNEVESGDPNPTRQECRTCHQIHTTYTVADWALDSTDPVALFAYGGAEYNGGSGNMCVNCHQSRQDFPEAVEGVVEVTSTHWGPHHGPQSATLLGIGGAGVDDSVSPHYAAVADTCVTCHMGEGRTHTFEPDVATCQGCHSGAESLDINGVQTEVAEMIEELEGYLIADGYLDEEGHPAVGELPEDKAVALWNWLYVAHEDGSFGVHNPNYVRAMLEAGLAVYR